MTDDIVKCGLCGMEVLATKSDMSAHAEFHIEMRYSVLERHNLDIDQTPIVFKHFNKEVERG